jgi:hypothetical protein
MGHSIHSTQDLKEKMMIKRSYLFAAAIALLYATVAAAQHPILDAVANKVVAKYQSSTCQQLMQSKAQKQPPSAGEQKAMEMLRTDPAMRHEFVTIVADQVVDKLIQCGMIP